MIYEFYFGLVPFYLLRKRKFLLDWLMIFCASMYFFSREEDLYIFFRLFCWIWSHNMFASFILSRKKLLERPSHLRDWELKQKNAWHRARSSAMRKENSNLPYMQRYVIVLKCPNGMLSFHYILAYISLMWRLSFIFSHHFLASFILLVWTLISHNCVWPWYVIGYGTGAHACIFIGLIGHQPPVVKYFYLSSFCWLGCNDSLPKLWKKRINLYWQVFSST